MTLLRTLLILLASATCLQADPFNPLMLRDAIASRDFDAADAGLAAAQEEFMQGTRSADEMRALYIALSRSAPETVAFVRDWLEREPDNHRAQIAVAWSLQNGAQNIRKGGNGISYQIAAEMKEEVRRLATAAYDTNPDLIPASDAMIRNLGRQDLTTYFPSTVLDEVLTKHPNYGSILRHMNELRGYSAGIIEGFCKSVAEDFGEARAPQITFKCMLDAALAHNLEGLDAYVAERLWTMTDPEFELERMAFVVQRMDYRELKDWQIDWARNVLLTHPMDQFQMAHHHYSAKRLDWILRSAFGRLDMVEHDYKRQRYAAVSAALEHDPYNLALIDLASNVEFVPPERLVKKEDGSWMITTAAPDLTPAERDRMRAADKAQRLDFAERRVLASPYNSAHWRSYAREVAHADQPNSMFDGDAAMINAIVLAEDPRELLREFVLDKADHYRNLTGLEARPVDEQAHLANWMTVLERTNLPQSVLCPALRAHVLKGAICTYYADDSPSCAPEQGELAAMVEGLIGAAGDAPECQGILAAETPEELWYEMNDFDAALNR